MRGYHLSALYAGVGMRTWFDIITEWLGVGDDTAKLRTFITLSLGETFEERGVAPRPDRIKARAEGYRAGTLPEGARPLIVTAGADVQDDRIEAEVVAWGRDFESWSIIYLVFWGDTADLSSPAWEGLHLALNAKHADQIIHAVLVDEGGHRTEQARLFCERFDFNVHPVKGESGGARGTGRLFTRREVAGHRVQTIALNVDYCKEVIYGHLAKGTPDGKPPREPFPGFAHFPIDYGDAYYKGLTAEEKFLQRGRDGRNTVRWRQVHKRNEPLDCRTYSYGALVTLFDDAKRQRGSEDPEEQYGWKQFWDEIEAKPKT
jgi:phage terminase large subunit GpA-like protein